MAPAADIAVIGGGMVGCATAHALADRGASVILLRDHRPGAASAAAAGMLAPSLDELEGAPRRVALAARDLFPPYLERLRERTGRSVMLDRNGVVRVALNEAEAAELRARLEPPGIWLGAVELRDLEPRLAPMAGAQFWPDDGSVDNVQLLAALEEAIAADPRVVVRDAGALAIDAGSAPARITTASGPAVEAGTVVLCAGAWAASIAGATCAKVIQPVRGQLLTLEGAAVRHCTYGSCGYLVPRPGCVIAGTTMEHAGFEPYTTAEGIAAIIAGVRMLCPELGNQPARSWAGLRPVTPDLLPLIGRDPDTPALIYACGHSRNGILLAPLTAEIVAALIFEEPLNFDLRQFDPGRFRGTLT